jgi:hypothetical protein
VYIGPANALMEAPRKFHNLKGNKSRNKADMPIPKILCSKVRVKSNCEHLTVGPNDSSRSLVQVIIMIKNGETIIRKEENRTDRDGGGL